VQSAKTIYGLPDKTLAEPLVEPFARSTKHYHFQVWPQWKAYSRSDAEKVALFNFRRPDFVEFDLANHGSQSETTEENIEINRDFMKPKVDQILKDAERKGEVARMASAKFLLNLLDRELDRIRNSKSSPHVYPYACPDEFWIPTILQISNLTNTPYMRLAKPGTLPMIRVPSPIEWKSWEERFASHTRSEQPSFNLQEQLRQACKNDALFFRKISKQLPPKQTWDLCR
jgi:hypothetical protein